MRMYQRIRELRKARGQSQVHMAQLLNVAQTTYSDYERGRINLPTEMLIALARYYNTSVDYLLGLTDVTEPYPAAEQ